MTKADVRQNGDAMSSSQEKRDVEGQNGMSSQGYVNPAYQVDTVSPASEKAAPTSANIQHEDVSGGDTKEVEEARRQRRDRDPLLFCKLVAEHPKKAFGFALAGHILFFLITVMLMARGYDIIPIEFDRLPLSITDDPDYLRGLAWDGRNEDADVIKRAEEDVVSQSERSDLYDVVDLIFEKRGGNVFTKENLMTIKEVEDDFFSDEEFQNKYCLLDNGNCAKPNSVVRYFDGTYEGTDAVFNDPDFTNIEAVLYEAYTNPETAKQFRSFLGKNANITATYVYSEITLAQLFVGLPLAGYSNSSDRETEQTDDIKKFMLNSYLKKGDRYFEKGAGAMDFMYNSITLLFVIITQQVFLDMALAFGSLAFIIIFICIQTGSLWVGLFAVLSIVTSFFGANIIYRVFCDFRYFGIFHVLALFIILGIGADDVFVFFDTWRETAHHEYKSLAHRLSDCYRKASLAMLFTSLTTFIAFVVSATSPFLGIYSFGLFAALLVFVNYISVITFFPAAVVTYHLYWEQYKCCCCCPKPVTVEAAENGAAPGAQSAGKRKNVFVRFFRGPFYTVVTHQVGKWCIMAFFAVFLAIFIYFATELEVNEEQVKFLKESSNTGRYLDRRANAFSREGDGAAVTQILLVWGLKEQSLKSCHHTDPDCTGDSVWDDTFNLNSVAAQQDFLNICNKLKNLPESDLDAMYIRRDVVTLKPEVQCFMDDMATFYLNRQGISLPITSAQVDSIINANSDIYDQPLPNGYGRHFEIATSYWLFDGFTFPPYDDFQKYNKIVGEGTEPFTKTVVTPASRTGFSFPYKYGTKLKYAAIIVNSSLVASNLGYPKGLEIRDLWEEWTQAETLVWNAIQGMLIGVCCAFPILVFATHNIITGSIATLTICCIIVCVIGVIPMSGWKLGLLESLNLVLVVGLSVDYVVHLAEGYSRSSHKERSGRVRDMLEEVGVSVLSGAVTTLGASFFLLFAEILFFTQFGLFMFSTIGLSILFALGFFTTVMSIIGPQNEFGSLKPLYRAIGRKCCKRSDSAEIS